MSDTLQKQQEYAKILNQKMVLLSSIEILINKT